MKRLMAIVLSLIMIILMFPISPITANATTSADLSISENGIAFIRAREGFHFKCYSDNTQSSIGYGTKCTDSSVQPHASGSHSITKDEAMQKLKSQINSTYVPIVRKQTNGIAMNQNQFDALVSLCYNCGGGTTLITNSPLVKYLKGTMSEAQARSEYSNYIVTSGGKKLQGLVNRRNLEADLFFENSSASTTSQNPDDYTIPTRDIVYKSSGTMTGSDVLWIQSVLYQLGYSIDVDGSFGPNTKKIVEQFQKDNGLTVDGSCGPATRSKLKDLWNQKKNATYSFSYNANGGTGETKSFTVKYNQDFAIVNNSCGKNGYHFGGWNVKRNNDNTWYVAGVGWCNEETISKNNYSKKNYINNQVCTLDNSWTKGLKAAGSYTFYATWIKDPITMSFNANGGAGNMNTITAEFGKEYTFPNCQFKKEGYIFSGWNAYRVNDGTWATEGHGWLTESELKKQGYTKQIIYSEDTKIFDDSWKNGCSDEYIQYIAYAVWETCSHDYLVTDESKPDCTNTGYIKYSCSNCEKQKTETIAAKGHSLITIAGKPATCTNTGLTDGSKCSVCGVILNAQQTIAAKGHSFSNWTTSKAATCTDTGTESRTCAVCQHTENRVIVAKGHTLITVSGKPATCTETGLTDGSKCFICGVIIKARETLSTISHNYVTTIIPATAISKGYTLHTCSVCGSSYRDNYTDPIIENAPKIIVENQAATVGRTVEVKISIKDNPGIASMRLHLSYDTSALKLIGVTDGGMLGTSNHPDNLNVYPYILSWTNDTVHENYTDDGTLVTLTFAVSSDAEPGDCDIKISYDNDFEEITDVDMNKVDFNVTNGVVSISNILVGDVNGDGKVTSKDRIILSRHLDNWDGYETLANPSAADINGDGKITSKDRTILSRYLDGWGTDYYVYFK